MRKLVEIRDAVGVQKQNSYVFPYTHAPVSHVSGWHAVKRTCTAANVSHPERLTATRMRHCDSTLYAAMHVTEPVIPY